jgi:hypothetical protein
VVFLAPTHALVDQLTEDLAARNDPPNNPALLELATQSGAPLSVVENLRDRLMAKTALPDTIEGWVRWIIDWLSADEPARLALLEREQR